MEHLKKTHIFVQFQVEDTKISYTFFKIQSFLGTSWSSIIEACLIKLLRTGSLKRNSGFSRSGRACNQWGYPLYFKNILGIPWLPYFSLSMIQVFSNDWFSVAEVAPSRPLYLFHVIAGVDRNGICKNGICRIIRVEMLLVKMVLVEIVQVQIVLEEMVQMKMVLAKLVLVEVVLVELLVVQLVLLKMVLVEMVLVELVLVEMVMV